ncbi:hypothetical protein GCK72_020944 [Caenorhabditis remanei]|uniref:Peptidase A1 domain-containing protein n=1 Tax=Caenorhabditis remanei TaxID=31234 RepID=A0A6A5GI77_CAERE|nr:hypothetical protein GCK72_020944 [Caenorhabditis remanei]KAF1754383.1 hypothetical protein GCK72_020944 [Caenorhabditis remanei]
MTRRLIVLFALLGFASAAQFSVPLRKSGSLRQKMIKEGRYSEYLLQRKSTGRQNFFDTMDEFYLADIFLGTPDQHFRVSVDTASSVVWVLDANCDSDNCRGLVQNVPLKHTYNSSASSTFQDSNKTFLFPYKEISEVYGLLGKEKVSMAGFTLTNQDFIRATVVPDFYTEQPVDGVLGLGWPDQQEL